MRSLRICIAVSVMITLAVLMVGTSAVAVLKDDEVLSQNIKEADGTSGQNTNVGSGVKTRHIQDGAVTNAKISGPIATDKLNVGTTAGTVAAGDHNHDAVYAAANHNHDALYQKKYANVVVVAENGGDYTNPVTAMSSLSNWCRPAGDTISPCLLKIMPGVYDIGTGLIEMQPYVDIEGSGEKVTVIIGANGDANFPPANAIVHGADNAEIRLLTLKNIVVANFSVYVATMVNNGKAPTITNVTAIASGGINNYAFYNTNSSATMTNVTAIASGGGRNFAISVTSSAPSSSPTMLNVTATASGGNPNQGIAVKSSSPMMINVRATASGGINSRNFGIGIDSSSATMTNVTAIASGGSEATGLLIGGGSPTLTNVTANALAGEGTFGSSSVGVRNIGSSPTMINVTATASGGTFLNWGLFNENSGTVKINNSVIRGTTSTINNGFGVTTLVANTQLDGGPITGFGALTCVGAFNGDYVALGTNCQ